MDEGGWGEEGLLTSSPRYVRRTRLLAKPLLRGSPSWEINNLEYQLYHPGGRPPPDLAPSAAAPTPILGLLRG